MCLWYIASASAILLCLGARAAQVDSATSEVCRAHGARARAAAIALAPVADAHRVNSRRTRARRARQEGAGPM